MELQPVENSTPNNPLPLHNILDGVSAVCAFGGAVAGALTQSAAVVAFPLAGAVCVHLFNRRRLMEETTQHYETLIRQQNLHIVNHQSSIKALSEQLQQLQHEWQEKLEQQDRVHLKRFGRQEEEYVEMQQLFTELGQCHQQLETEHRQLADIVGELRQIENFSQALQANSDAAETYYQRGLSHQRLNDRQGAVADFTEAIEFNPLCAKAYHARGVLHADSGDRKAAVFDLREAAKLYFDGGDIKSYQKARDLVRDLYNLGVEGDVTDTTSQSEQVLVGNLFDCN